MDDINVSQNMTPETTANSGDVLPQNLRIRDVLGTEVSVNHNKDAEVDWLLDGKNVKHVK